MKHKADTLRKMAIANGKSGVVMNRKIETKRKGERERKNVRMFCCMDMSWHSDSSLKVANATHIDIYSKTVLSFRCLTLYSNFMCVSLCRLHRERCTLEFLNVASGRAYYVFYLDIAKNRKRRVNDLSYSWQMQAHHSFVDVLLCFAFVCVCISFRFTFILFTCHSNALSSCTCCCALFSYPSVCVCMAMLTPFGKKWSNFSLCWPIQLHGSCFWAASE